ncbi:MAG: hypothetical protein CMF52_06950 [Legionellales bacterium]|nr:hypothetical protein [Legionellales bacterium]|tara:strand:+ start:4291 stop:4596 length:306 start_codon:yes stop_codon:yes gene_type:complete
MNNDDLYVSKDETTYNTVRTRTWAYGVEKRFFHTGLQRPFTITSSQHGEECTTSPELVTFTVNGTGVYGGNIRPLEFYLDSGDVDGLIKMLKEVKKSMKQR